jgi:hypothetical protein
MHATAPARIATASEFVGGLPGIVTTSRQLRADSRAPGRRAAIRP